MHLIRTAEALANACEPPTDPELQSLLGGYAAALEEFGDYLQADILIVEAGDTVDQAERALTKRLVSEGHFTFPVELIDRGEQWISVVSIYGDDGSGLVLLVQITEGTNRELLAACEHALDQVTR